MSGLSYNSAIVTRSGTTVILSQSEVGRAAEILRAGGLVVFPTETVYGLGANAFDAAACAGIFAAKDRPADNPLIVHLAGVSQLPLVARQAVPLARLLLQRFAPGPFTIILPRSQQIPDIVTAGLDGVALRIPSNQVARALLAHCEFPVAAPSANRSGRPSPTDFDAAFAHMNGRVDAIVRGPDCEIGLESTIVRLNGSDVEVLREGAVTREMLSEALQGRAALLEPHHGAAVAPDHPPQAPGTRYRHYQPEARLLAVEAAEVGAALQQHRDAGTAFLVLRRGELYRLPLHDSELFAFDSVEHYARELYRCLHACDQRGCTTIIAELPPSDGVGRALRDRLLRAAG